MPDQLTGQPEQDNRIARLRRYGRVFTAAMTVLGVIGLIAVYSVTTRHPWTDDAEIFANYIGIAPVVEGPILHLNVADNQRVRQGDLLFEIDDRPYKYALDHAISDQAALEGQIVDEQRRIQAEVHAVTAFGAATRSASANVDRAQASIREAEADVAHSEAALDRAKTEWAYAENNLHRVEPLLVKQFVTVDQVDQARTTEQASAQSVHEAESELALDRAHLNSMLAALAQAKASEEQSTAQFHQSQSSVLTLDPLVAQRQGRAAAIANAQYNYNHSRVYAPFDARVSNLVIAEGAYAHIGQEIFTLIDTRVWWVLANFRETQLKYVRPGMTADIYVMSDPGLRFTGVVESVGYGVTPDPSILGRITPGLPDVQRTLSWVHLASRYPVRIRIESPPSDVIRLGESAVVVIRGYKRKR
ncbi:MAG TPA: HlyD family efflux transporter periplasmic adaptor subunit [Verrucomicrobiae bacterium]|nr:HlyD family efflux transporter periplasmic adaptor subunit [Verrucomicrobiae bacterium]